MAGFTICTFKGQPAVQFHHNFGDFEFVMVKDPKDENKIKFDSNVILTNKLYNMIGEQAIKSVLIFGKRFGYSEGDEIGFDDVIKILRQAQSYAAEKAKARG